VAITGFSDDSGTAGDNITSDNTLLINGTVGTLGPDERLELSINNGAWTSNNINVDGNTWSYQDSARISGSVTYRIRVAKGTGADLIKGNSDERIILIDQLAPSLSVNPVDTYISAAERLNPTFISGTSEPNSTVTLNWKSESGDILQTSEATVAANGFWSLTYQPEELLGAGTYFLEFSSIDAAGNSSAIITRNTTIENSNTAPFNLRLIGAAGITNETAIGHVIGTLIADDLQGDVLLYKKNGEDFLDNTLINIDQQTGKITLAKSLDKLDKTTLDRIVSTGLRLSLSAVDKGEGSLSASKIVSIAYTQNNTAPVALNANTAVDLEPITSRTAATEITGQTVNSLFSNRFDDIDTDLMSGVAIISNESVINQGRWQYRYSGSSSWNDFPQAESSRPFVLMATDSIRFVPSSTFVGSPGALNVHLLDSSRIWSRGLLPIGEFFQTGGNGSASSQTLRLTTTVRPRNELPNDIIPDDNAAVDFDQATQFTVTAQDIDTLPNQIKYELTKVAGKTIDLTGYFSIDDSSGEISLNKTWSDLNQTTKLELQEGLEALNFTIRAYDAFDVDKSRFFEKQIRIAFSNSDNQNRAPELHDTSNSFKADTETTYTLLSLEQQSLEGETFKEILFPENGATLSFNDPDNQSNFAGVSIISNKANPSAEGIWQYSTDGGNTYIKLPSVSDDLALHLDSSSYLRFLPRAGFIGQPGALGVRLLESSEEWNPGDLKAVNPGGPGYATIRTVNISTTVIFSQAPSQLDLIGLLPITEQTNQGQIIGKVIFNDPDSKPEVLELVTDELDPRFGITANNQLIWKGVFDELGDEKNQGFIEISLRVKDESNNSLQKKFRVPLQYGANRSPEIQPSFASNIPSWAPLSDPQALSNSIFLEEASSDQARGSSFSAGSVGNIFSPRFFDVDSPLSNPLEEFWGILISENDAALNRFNGNWQFQASGGSWQDIDLRNGPLLIDRDSNLRFRPSASFNGNVPPLKVRLVDTSVLDDGVPKSADQVIAGGSGAASLGLLELHTFISKPESVGPTTIAFSQARDIPLDNTNSVAGGTLLGVIIAFDPDTDAADLKYSLLENSGAIYNGIALSEYIELVNGNQVRVKSGIESIPLNELLKTRFSFSVADENNNTKNSPADILLSADRFTQVQSSISRSESVVVPLVSTGGSAPNEPIVFTATGTSSSLTASQLNTLSQDDLLATGLDFSGTTEVIPLTPLLEFAVAPETPGDVVRFEFSLSNALSFEELLGIGYLKLSSDGTVSLYEQELDDYGVFTGARLEQYDSSTDSFKPLVDLEGRPNNQYSSTGPTPVLAVYVQDNGRGDDDLSLGIVRDPGAPLLRLPEVTITVTAPAANTSGVAAPSQTSTPVPSQPQSTEPEDSVDPEDGSAPADDISVVTPTVKTLVINPETINFDEKGTAEADLYRINPSNVDDQGNISLALGAGDDKLTISKKARTSNVIVDAGDGNDVIRTKQGSDVVIAGAGDDLIKASSKVKPRKKEQAEIDKLSGGEGSDQFVLGVGKGSLYLDIKGRGNSSYALISDLGDGDQVQLSRSDKKSYKLKAKQHPDFPDIDGYALYAKNDMIAFIVLDEDNQARELSLKDREIFTYRKG
jgi:hypothetical protein